MTEEKKQDVSLAEVTMLPVDPYIFDIQFHLDGLQRFRLWFPELALFDSDSSRALTKEFTNREWVEKTQDGFSVIGKIDKNAWEIDYNYNVKLYADHVIQLDLEVKNTGKLPWSAYAQLAVCLAPVSKAFSDTAGYRTFLHVGPDQLKSLQEAGAVDDFNHYPVSPRNDSTDPDQKIQVSSGFVSRLSADKELVISFAWDKSARVDVNPGGLDCIHSHPAIGPLQPGEKIKRTGFIILTNKVAHENFKILKDLLGRSINH
jgi:hypothetical protein